MNFSAEATDAFPLSCQRLGIPTAHPPASYPQYKSSCLWAGRGRAANLRKTFRPQDRPGACVQGLMSQEVEPQPPLLSPLIPGLPDVVPAAGKPSIPNGSQRASFSPTAITATPLSQSDECSRSQEKGLHQHLNLCSGMHFTKRWPNKGGS